LIDGCGLGRSTSFIPAVPAAWSVTTIALICHLLAWHTQPTPGRAQLGPLSGAPEEEEGSSHPLDSFQAYRRVT